MNNPDVAGVIERLERYVARLENDHIVKAYSLVSASDLRTLIAIARRARDGWEIAMRTGAGNVTAKAFSDWLLHGDPLPAPPNNGADV